MLISDLKKHGVILSVINYKNNDYTPTFFKNKLVKSEENFKTITVTCVFNVDNSLIKNIESVKNLLQKVIIEDNNLEYELFFESMSELSITEEVTATVIYTCKGNIFSPRQKLVIAGKGKAHIQTLKDVPINLNITKAQGRVTINDMIFKQLKPNQVVHIDSENGRVSGIPNANWDFVEFPKTKNKIFEYTITGKAKIEINYRGKF